MNGGYVSRGVGVAMLATESVALLATAVLATFAMSRCPGADASAFRQLPMMMSVLPLLSGFGLA
jgi:hypothetical protein